MSDLFLNNLVYILLYSLANVTDFNVRRFYTRQNPNNMAMMLISNIVFIISIASLVLFGINTSWYYPLILLPVGFILGELLQIIFRFGVFFSLIVSVISSITILTLQIIAL